MRHKYMIFITFIAASCSNATQEAGAQKAQIPPQKPAENIVLTAKKTSEPSLERGAKVFRYCKACHTLDENGRHKVGPNLWGVYGRTAGTKEDFRYSKAMKASGVIWTEETMDAYLTKPSAFMKGTLMNFVGVKKQTDRDSLQLYLKAKTSPVPEEAPEE